MLFLVVWRYGLDDDIMRNSAHRLSHGSISPESSGRWNEKSKNLSTILLTSHIITILFVIVTMMRQSLPSTKNKIFLSRGFLPLFVVCSGFVWLLFIHLNGSDPMDPSVLLDLQRMKSRSLRTTSIEHDLTATLSSKQSDDQGNGWSHSNPLGIPQGEAPNLPSIRVEDVESDANVDEKRKIYGGKGDKPHLGGFTDLDLQGVSPGTWKYMIKDFNIHSILDIGCGRGISTSWFLDHGLDALGVDGSHDALEQSILDDPSTQMVEHDFSRGKNAVSWTSMKEKRSFDERV